MNSTSAARRALFLAAASLLLFASASGPAAPAPASRSVDRILDGSSRGRDPLGLVRTLVPPRVWVLLDTSTSMDRRAGGRRRTRLHEAREVIRWAASTFVSDAGDPLVAWGLARFRDFDLQNRSEGVCRDPYFGAGVPSLSPSGPPATSMIQCGGLSLLARPAGCNFVAQRSAILRRLPWEANSTHTPAGIALLQLASYIANEATEDLAPGQRNIVLFLTDGVDSCECGKRIWNDFTAGSPGVLRRRPVELRVLGTAPTLVEQHGIEGSARTRVMQAHNAGLKARDAMLRLNRGDPANGFGEIHIVGFAMEAEFSRGLTNHLAWMASDLERPAIHAADREGLRSAISAVLSEVTLPDGSVKLAEPRLAAVKELAGGELTGGDVTGGRRRDFVADPNDPAALNEVLARRREHQDNVLVTTEADLRGLQATVRAVPVSEEGDVSGAPVWDAGALLAARDPEDRLIWFHRRGETRLRPFTVAEVRPEDLGVGAGYLDALDGAGARSAADAAEIVVRLIRGEEIEVHPETGSIYGSDGGLHFVGGAGSPKLRESLASPVVVGAPPSRTGAGPAWERFFHAQVNRRTLVYLPANGGMLHAFSAETGAEAFAFIPADALGPLPGDSGAGPFLRDLALARVRGAPGLRRGLESRFSLAGSPVVRDLPLAGGEWATVLAFGRSFGGRFVTALDVTAIGGAWSGDREPPSRWPAGAKRPRLLWSMGPEAPGFAGLRETPAPVFAEVSPGFGAEWLVFQSSGDGAGSAGASLFVLEPADGRLRRAFHLPSAPDAAIPRNGAPTAPAPWSPRWASRAAPDHVSAVYVADLHGQIHRLRPTGSPGALELRTVHRLGGRHPVHARPVAFPFPGRAEPHLLVVTGGDRRLPGGPAHMVLLRDLGDRMEEVWRKPLPAGEAPQGRPVVRADNFGVEVVLPTLTTASSSSIGCGGVRTEVGVSRLRAFDGVSGEPLAGVVADDAPFVDFGPSRIRGVSLSSTGNMALSVTEAAGGVLDTVIGDFRFRIRDSALEPITLFVEGFRRSPF